MPTTMGGVKLPSPTGKFLKDDGTWAAPQGGGGADIKSGVVNLAAGGSTAVTFAKPFASTPHVVVTSQINNADTSCTYSVHAVSANGFTLRGAGNPAGSVAWIATTAGNS